RRAGCVDIAGAFDEPAVIDDQIAGAGDRTVVADEAALDAHVAAAEVQCAAGSDLAVIGVVAADGGYAAAAQDKAVAVDFKCAARVSASDGKPASTLVTVLSESVAIQSDHTGTRLSAAREGQCLAASDSDRGSSGDVVEKEVAVDDIHRGAERQGRAIEGRVG